MSEKRYQGGLSEELDRLTEEENAEQEQYLRRKEIRRQRQLQARRRQRMMLLGAFLVVLLIIAVIVGAVSAAVKSHKRKVAEREAAIAASEEAERLAEEARQKRKAMIGEAEKLALTYDYDGAIEQLKSVEDYEQDTDITAKISEYEEIKNSCVSWTASQVTHIFYHSLVVDPDLAFAGNDSTAAGFKQWMTTIYEFDKITQTMYDEGYVLISIYDLAEELTDADGNVTFREKEILLPPGKTPFILSLDDLSYYHSYDGRGIASKLIVDADGKVTCEYTAADGSVTTGSYDCVPRLDDFLEEHPDGCYHGARGTVALTGYNGILGYRTDNSYVTQVDINADKKAWLAAHPDFDHDAEVAGAKKVADAMKANGWTFASHTWGHLHVRDLSMERLQTDTEKWLDNVAPIVGGSNCIIFAHGQDLTSTGRYSDSDANYAYLRSKGFYYYFNVDSYKLTTTVTEKYVHGGRRNLDGYRLWYDVHGDNNKTSDLFNAADVLDPARTDVPQL